MKQKFIPRLFRIHTEERLNCWHVENRLCLPEFIHTDIHVSVARARKLTSSNLPDNGCNGATGPLAFSVTRHHACVETGWQPGALGPTVVADGAFRGWTMPRCVNHNLVMDSERPPTSSADMCHNFAYKPSNSLPDILTAEDLIKKCCLFCSMVTNKSRFHLQKKTVCIGLHDYWKIMAYFVIIVTDFCV